MAAHRIRLDGIGFAVRRIGLFLRELGTRNSHLPPHKTGFSLWSGVALVGLGVIVNVGAVLNHIRLICELRSGAWTAERISVEAVSLGLLLAAVGVGMAIYLVLVH